MYLLSPAGVGDEFSEGCNFLVRNNKAALLTNVADLAYSMGWEKQEGPPVTQQLTLPISLSADEQTIFEIIRQNKQPMAIDELSIKINLPVSILAMNLLNMEMQGYIRSLPGKIYTIN
jgi:DNA processing protein